MRRHLAALAVLVTTLALVSACGDDEPSGGGGDTKTIEIKFSGGKVTPNGDRVKVDVGQPIDLVVEADEAGEIHMHSEPEQEFAYKAGTTTFEIEIDRPGIVDVESHELDATIVQLEVS